MSCTLLNKNLLLDCALFSILKALADLELVGLFRANAYETKAKV